jgi:hypothetical protein
MSICSLTRELLGLACLLEQPFWVIANQMGNKIASCMMLASTGFTQEQQQGRY